MPRFRLLYEYESGNEPDYPYVYLRDGAIVEFAKYAPGDDDWDENDEYVLIYHENVGKVEVPSEQLEVLPEE